MRTSVLHTVLAAALVVGTACAGPDNTDPVANTDAMSGTARGANVPGATDTLARGSATFNTASGAFTYTVETNPTAGTLDSIALYQVGAATVALPAAATALLCGPPATACAAGSGSGTAVAPANVALTATQLAAIKTSIRAYGTQLVFFTTTAQKPAGGAMRGTMYPEP